MPKHESAGIPYEQRAYLIKNGLLKIIGKNGCSESLLIRGLARASGLSTIRDGELEAALLKLLEEGKIRSIQGQHGRGKRYVQTCFSEEQNALTSIATTGSHGPFRINYNQDTNTLEVCVEGTYYPILEDRRGLYYILIAGRKVYIEQTDDGAIVQIDGKVTIQGSGDLGDFTTTVRDLKIILSITIAILMVSLPFFF